MRHLLLPAGAIAVAFWLSPAFAHLPEAKRTGTAVVVAVIFFVAWIALNRRAKAKKATSHTTPYAFRLPAKGRK